MANTARQCGCRRLWLITTNDNLVAVHPNALKAARKIKPQIPLIGNWRIPLRDEIELELALP